MTSRKKFIKNSVALLIGSTLGFDKLLKAAVFSSKFNNQLNPFSTGFVDHTFDLQRNIPHQVFTKSENGWDQVS